MEYGVFRVKLDGYVVIRTKSGTTRRNKIHAFPSVGDVVEFKAGTVTRRGIVSKSCQKIVKGKDESYIEVEIHSMQQNALKSEKVDLILQYPNSRITKER